MVESYVAVDLEMTGLHAKTDRILEIGAVKVEEGKCSSVFHRMVDPKIKVPIEITELTGITDEMVKYGCNTEMAVAGFVEFAQGFPLVGHNIMFDYSFLKQCAVNQGIAFEKEGIDTLKLAREFLPEAEKKTLEYLCAYLNIPRGRNHRALEDAMAADYLFRYLSEQFGEAEPGAFLPKPLLYKVKKQSPATKRQKKYLKELEAWHKIDLDVEIDSLTRSEASRITNRVLKAYGKAPRQ